MFSRRKTTPVKAAPLWLSIYPNQRAIKDTHIHTPSHHSHSQLSDRKAQKLTKQQESNPGGLFLKSLAGTDRKAKQSLLSAFASPSELGKQLWVVGQAPWILFFTNSEWAKNWQTFPSLSVSRAHTLYLPYLPSWQVELASVCNLPEGEVPLVPSLAIHVGPQLQSAGW